MKIENRPMYLRFSRSLLKYLELAKKVLLKNSNLPDGGLLAMFCPAVSDRVVFQQASAKKYLKTSCLPMANEYVFWSGSLGSVLVETPAAERNNVRLSDAIFQPASVSQLVLYFYASILKVPPRKTLSTF